MKIGELARLANCTTDTIRFYEKEGLLPEAERTDANYRSYSERHGNVVPDDFPVTPSSRAGIAKSERRPGAKLARPNDNFEIATMCRYHFQALEHRTGQYCLESIRTRPEPGNTWLASATKAYQVLGMGEKTRQQAWPEIHRL